MNKKITARQFVFDRKTVRTAIYFLTLILELVLFCCLTTKEAQAVKLVSTKIDRWYRMESDWGVMKTWPDKFQHLFFPYLLQESNQRLLRSEKVFWAFNLFGVVKEFDDKEGVSWRDILCNTIGYWGAKYRTENFTLLPIFEEQEQNWKIMALISF